MNLRLPSRNLNSHRLSPACHSRLQLLRYDPLSTLPRHRSLQRIRLALLSHHHPLLLLLLSKVRRSGPNKINRLLYPLPLINVRLPRRNVISGERRSRRTLSTCKRAKLSTNDEKAGIVRTAVLPNPTSKGERQNASRQTCLDKGRGKVHGSERIC